MAKIQGSPTQVRITARLIAIPLFRIASANQMVWIRTVEGKFFLEISNSLLNFPTTAIPPPAFEKSHEA